MQIQNAQCRRRKRSWSFAGKEGTSFEAEDGEETLGSEVADQCVAAGDVVGTVAAAAAEAETHSAYADDEAVERNALAAAEVGGPAGFGGGLGGEVAAAAVS